MTDSEVTKGKQVWVNRDADDLATCTEGEGVEKDEKQAVAMA